MKSGTSVVKSGYVKVRKYEYLALTDNLEAHLDARAKIGLNTLWNSIINKQEVPLGNYAKSLTQQ